jgi:NADH-quinone oxidoreductase subunit F
VAPAEIFGVASFYHLFSLEPRSGPVVHRCVDIACQVNGAVVADDEHASPCLGLCERAPAALVIEAGAPPRVG